MNRGWNHWSLSEQGVKSLFLKWTEDGITVPSMNRGYNSQALSCNSCRALGLLFEELIPRGNHCISLHTIADVWKSKFQDFRSGFRAFRRSECIRMCQNRSEMNCKLNFSCPNSLKTQKISFLEWKMRKIDSKISISQTSGLNRYPYVMCISVGPNRTHATRFDCFSNRYRHGVGNVMWISADP